MTKNQLSSDISLQDISDLLDRKLDERFKASEQEMKAYFDTGMNGLKGDIASLTLKNIRLEKKLDERTAYFPSFANGVDSFMGEIVESREDRIKADEKLKGHEKRLCVLEYAVLRAPKNKKKYGA